MSDPLGGFLEGLMGGFQAGHSFRTGIQDRKRKLATEEEERTYERARRLREDVAFGLQQRVGEGQLAAQRREGDEYTRRMTQDADRRARVAAAAAQIRQQYGTNPRYKGITLLPDEDLVREFGDLISNPQRFDRPAGDSPARATTRQDLASVERQVDDTRADLARAERDVPQRPMFFLSPSDSTRFVGDSAASASRVGGLRQRADSLSTVRDSLAASVQGRQFRRPQPQQKSPADRWEELVAQGVSPAEATRRVKQEYNLP